MPLTQADLALLHTLVLNALLLGGAWCCARRYTTSRAQAVLDALLLWLTAQYAIVGLLGACGWLSTAAMTLAGVTVGAVLLLLARPWQAARSAPESAGLAPSFAGGGGAPGRLACEPFGRQHFGALIVSLLALGYLAACGFAQRSLPPTATDAIAYHLPTAVQWLQDGAIRIWPAWYWNLANSYSPLAGETFIAWLLAPAGNDVFARYVQVAPLLMIYLCVLQCGRLCGASLLSSALMGLALVLSRPMLSQAFLVKDDLIMAAMFAAAVVALHPSRLSERWGGVRAGLAVGLLLATKYPALVVAPVLLLMVDAPFRTRCNWRHCFGFFLTALAIAAPWYLRNALETGNPLYPIEIVVGGRTVLPGLFTVARHEELASVVGVWHMLTRGFHALPPWLLLAVLAMAAAAAWTTWRRLLHDPLLRLCVLGPPLGLLCFVVLSPHPEVRYFFPLLIPLFAAAALGCSLPLSPKYGSLAAGVLAAAAIATGFTHGLASQVLTQLLIAIGFAVTALLTWQFCRGSMRRVMGTIAVITLLLVVTGYVYWNAYVSVYEEATDYVWADQYRPESPLWTFVRSQTPADAVIDYAGTNFIYPLYGFELSRRVLHVPVSAEIPNFAEFPMLGRGLEGYDLVRLTTARMHASADYDMWRRRLLEQRATHLMVLSTLGPAPEREFAAAHPELFRPLHTAAAGVVYAIRRQAP
jgi:hypothetical protein